MNATRWFEDMPSNGVLNRTSVRQPLRQAPVFDKGALQAEASIGKTALADGLEVVIATQRGTQQSRQVAQLPLGLACALALVLPHPPPQRQHQEHGDPQRMAAEEIPEGEDVAIVNHSDLTYSKLSLNTWALSPASIAGDGAARSGFDSSDSTPRSE